MSRPGGAASVQETATCIDVAMALGYIDGVDGKSAKALESVGRVLVAIVA